MSHGDIPSISLYQTLMVPAPYPQSALLSEVDVQYAIVPPHDC